MAPQPAPEVIRYERDDDGVVLFTMDDPDRKVNVLNEAFLDALTAAVDRLESERETVRGVIITSAKNSFHAGADLGGMADVRPGQAAELATRIGRCHSLFRRLEQLGRPVVAAMNGSAIGGGYELALACHHRIALDTPDALIGLSEATYGILPDLGGLTRAVRMFGIETALDSLLLDGRLYGVREARDRGLVDSVVTAPRSLLAQARRWIAAHPAAVQPWDTAHYRIPGGAPGQPAFAASLAVLPAALRMRTGGAPGKVGRNIVAAAVEGAQVDFDTALSVETRYAIELALDPLFGNLVNTALDRREADRAFDRPRVAPRQIRTVLVVGAGPMGAGIAKACALAGIDVVLHDVSDAAAELGRDHVARGLDTCVARSLLTRAQRDAALARITPTTRLADAVAADLVIEAVPDDDPRKRRVLAEAERYAAPHAVLAHTTATASIGAIADAVRRPAEVAGLHVLLPMEQTKLVEIIVTPKTSDATLAVAIGLARRLRRTPIVVTDTPGFFTGRVLGLFGEEALVLLSEGIPAASIEQAAIQTGQRRGPLAMMDEAGLTLIRALTTDTTATSARPAGRILDLLIDQYGRTGAAGAAGFYEYADHRRLRLWPGLSAAVGAARTDPLLTEIQERLLFRQALEAVRCVEEGVVRSVAQANIGSLLGVGFPAWTGGALRYIDQYAGGAVGFAARARDLASRYGQRFNPPPSLLESARQAAPYGVR